MTSHAAALVWGQQRRDVNQSSDPRVGSARDNSTGTSVLRVSATNSASYATLFATFVPVAVYATICFLIFLTLRRKYPRVYAPRTFLKSLDAHERVASLPTGWFNWMKAFWKLPDTAVLNHSSLEGYLFLRYLKVLCVICLVGVCLIWPILLPLHAYGGAGRQQLDRITFGNVANPKFFYAHAILAWLYFGFIMYMVIRESIFFINLRQAYLTSPYYAERLSSRTVLFTCVPQQDLDEKRLRRIFGNAVRKVWIPREEEELEDLVAEREQTATRLEKAEIELIRMADAARSRAQGTSPKHLATPEADNGSTHTSQSSKMRDVDIEANNLESSQASPKEADGGDPTAHDTPPSITIYGSNGPPPNINGSVASQWIPHSSRPSHRPLANYGRRVDTIKWTRTRIEELNLKINQMRRKVRSGNGQPLPAAFIEFDTLAHAQSAYQTLAHHRANHMTPHTIGVRPNEIVWASLRVKWWEKIIRNFSTQGIVALAVIFWSLPCAIVGIISNIQFLTTKLTFLSFINSLPSPVLGLISGLLPAVALSALMSLVPYMMRFLGKQAGLPTLSQVELFVQNTYFIFEVVQVFLVTTLTSAASAALTDILEDPTSARTVLSQNLPKASNFYLSYFILQGLAMSGTRMVHLFSLFRFHVMPQSNTPPRTRAKSWYHMRRVQWGGVYPVFSNMMVIAISYCCIAPIILGFAGIGLFILYMAYRYNLLYTYDSELDTRGLLYPQALQHILTGLYLAEVCLFGLFGLAGAYGPVVIMLMLIIFTTLIHSSITSSLAQLTYSLPRTLAMEEQGLLSEEGQTDELQDDDMEIRYNGHNGYGPDVVMPFEKEEDEVEETTRAVEGGKRGFRLTFRFAKAFVISKINSQLTIFTTLISPSPDLIHREPVHTLLKFLHPELFASHSTLYDLIPPDQPIPAYSPTTIRDAFFPPYMVTRVPKLWIPRDIGGVSAQELAHSGKMVEITDEGAWVAERKKGKKGWGKIEVDLDTAEWVMGERIRY